MQKDRCIMSAQFVEAVEQLLRTYERFKAHGVNLTTSYVTRLSIEEVEAVAGRQGRRRAECSQIAAGVPILSQVHHSRDQEGLREAAGTIVESLQKAREALTRRSTTPRKRRSKAEVTLKVQAAILHKIDNPGASESKCAVKAELPRTTLAGNAVWKEWSPKIEEAARRGRLDKLKAKWDQRTGRFLEIVAPSDLT